jgi:hypothetical protein
LEPNPLGVRRSKASSLSRCGAIGRPWQKCQSKKKWSGGAGGFQQQRGGPLSRVWRRTPLRASLLRIFPTSLLRERADNADERVFRLEEDLDMVCSKLEEERSYAEELLSTAESQLNMRDEFVAALATSLPEAEAEATKNLCRCCDQPSRVIRPRPRPRPRGRRLGPALVRTGRVGKMGFGLVVIAKDLSYKLWLAFLRKCPSFHFTFSKRPVTCYLFGTDRSQGLTAPTSGRLSYL